MCTSTCLGNIIRRRMSLVLVYIYRNILFPCVHTILSHTSYYMTWSIIIVNMVDLVACLYSSLCLSSMILLAGLSSIWLKHCWKHKIWINNYGTWRQLFTSNCIFVSIYIYIYSTLVLLIYCMNIYTVCVCSRGSHLKDSLSQDDRNAGIKWSWRL